MSRVKVKVPKGTRDFDPEQMAVREKAFGIVTSVFKRHGAVTIETPVFELRETLLNKYGEDSKLIYDIADQGGEILSLRYDLTVPFARYLATHKVRNIKRYHIARVYRRDQPSIERGRFREFYQCDLDIAGEYPPMVPDAEVLKVVCELLNELASVSEFHHKYLGSYQIKLNHRKILDGVFKVCGVPEDKIRAISSSIDKLDKLSWENVRTEMVSTKGLSDECADRIGKYVFPDGKRREGEPLALLATLREDAELVAECGPALDELDLLFQFLEVMGVMDRIVLDLCLARGLDYYTGVIFEAVLTDGKSSVGSIAAGGRYDTLVGGFFGREVPCVGCSLGIERVLAIMTLAEKEAAESQQGKIRAVATDIYVGSLGGGVDMLKERMRICSELWNRGLRAELNYANKPNMKRQLEHALENQIPLLALIGETELANGVVQVKKVQSKEAVDVPRDNMVAEIQSILNELAPPL